MSRRPAKPRREPAKRAAARVKRAAPPAAGAHTPAPDRGALAHAFAASSTRRAALERLLTEARRLSRAETGTVYLREGEADTFHTFARTTRLLAFARVCSLDHQASLG